MKRKTKGIFILVFLFLFGIFSTVRGLGDKSEIAKAADFNILSDRDFYVGQIVRGYVYEVYGEYAYEEEYNETLGFKSNQRVSAHYYLVPLSGSVEKGEVRYVTMKIRSEDVIGEAETLMEQTWLFINEGTEPEEWNEFPFQGKVSKLDSELEGHLYSWLTSDGADGTRADYEQYIYPYVLSEFDDSAAERETVSGIVMLLIGGVGLAAIAIFYFSKRGYVTPPSPPAEYVPEGSGRASSSGSVYSPADGGEGDRLAAEMEKLSQPADAEEFFSAPLTGDGDDDKK